MNINLNTIIEAVLALIAALITYRLIPWIKAHTTQKQQANLAAVTRTLVYAAEQLYGANCGAEKLEYVTRQLEARGIDVDPAVIEEAVYKMQRTVTGTMELFAEEDEEDGEDAFWNEAYERQFSEKDDEDTSDDDVPDEEAPESSEE